eukprot:ctg_1477.g398
MRGAVRVSLHAAAPAAEHAGGAAVPAGRVARRRRAEPVLQRGLSGAHVGVSVYVSAKSAAAALRRDARGAGAAGAGARVHRGGVPADRPAARAAASVCVCAGHHGASGTTGGGQGVCAQGVGAVAAGRGGGSDHFRAERARA